MTPEPTASAKSIVVSLEHAKALKEARWPQDAHSDADNAHLPNESVGSVFIWEDETRRCDIPACNCGKSHGNWIVKCRTECNYNPWVAAPTAEEILRRLPCKWEVFQNEISPTLKEIIVSCFTGGEQHYSPGIHSSLVNAAASMYCYLAKNNLLPKP